jgi:hypothetical protein
MHARRASLVTAAGLLVLASASPGPADDRPPGKGKAEPVTVVVDTSGAPELATWADKARGLVVKWHPLIADLLKSDGFTPAREVKLVFKSDMRAPASTSGDTISVNAEHVKRHPDDFGMVIHELTHVLQRYPSVDKDTWWLVEGIADYVRFYRFEPNARIGRLDLARAGYRDGYRTSARFLAWVSRRYDKELVPRLNAALRKGEYRPELFEEYTGKSLDQLWAEFVRAAPAR